VIKIHSTPSFGFEVKLEVSCRKILQHVKDLLQVPWGLLLLSLPHGASQH
jgi:hypothetical protein